MHLCQTCGDKEAYQLKKKARKLRLVLAWALACTHCLLLLFGACSTCSTCGPRYPRLIISSLLLHGKHLTESNQLSVAADLPSTASVPPPPPPPTHPHIHTPPPPLLRLLSPPTPAPPLPFCSPSLRSLTHRKYVVDGLRDPLQASASPFCHCSLPGPFPPSPIPMSLARLACEV